MRRVCRWAATLVLGALLAGHGLAEPQPPHVRGADARTDRNRQKERRQLEGWPALADGKLVHRTFRFRPASIRYLCLPTVRMRVQVLFEIDDATVPADFYLWSGAFQSETARDAVNSLLAADGGWITVDATWVNAGDSLDSERYERCEPSPCTRVSGDFLIGDLVEPGMRPRAPAAPR